MAKNLQFLRGNSSVKPELKDGQGYLEKDTSVFVIKNDSAEVRLSDQSSNISALQSGLQTTNETVSTLSGNISSINSQLSAMKQFKQASGTTPASWSSTTNVNISGITANDIPIIIPQWTSNKTNEQEAWNKITGAQSNAGYITFTSDEAISVAVNFVCYY